MANSTQLILDLIAKNDLTGALAAAIELVAQTPTDADNLHLLGLIYKRLGQLDKAQQCLSKAVSLAPNNSEVYNNLANIYYMQGQIQQAIPVFQKAIRLDPQSWEAHYNLANCYIKQDMVLQGITHYETTLKLNPTHGNAKINLAMAFVNEKDYASALPLLIEIAAHNPEHAEIQGHLAAAYLELGQSKNALDQFAQAVALDPNRAKWHHNLAVLYLREQDLEKAKNHFTESLHLEPNNTTAQHMLHALTQTNTNTTPREYIKDLFDQYASYYNEHVKDQLDYQVPYKLRQIIGKFIGHSDTLQNVLDLGCGTGLCGIYFRDLARYIFGVDLSANMLQQAYKLGAYDGLCIYDITQAIPGQSQSNIDLVLAADVFVYIGDLQQVFANICSALRVKGKICFSIELSQDADFKLQTTGRFAHSKEYINKLCANFNLEDIFCEQTVLRKNADRDIYGLIYILQLR